MLSLEYQLMYGLSPTFMSSEIHLIPDRTVIIQLGVFISVLASLSYFVFKPLAKIIKARKEKTIRLIKDAEDIEAKIKGYSEKYTKEMNAARDAAHKEKEKIRQIGLNEEASIKTAARNEVASIIRKAQATIEEAKRKALDDLKKDIPTIAEDIIKRIKK